MKKYKRVKSLEELRCSASQSCGADVHINLSGGIKSSKHLQWLPKEKKFYILNLIDDSEQYLTLKQIMNHNLTNIGKALEYGALFYD